MCETKSENDVFGRKLQKRTQLGRIVKENTAKNNDFLKEKMKEKCREKGRFFVKENQTKGREKRCF